MNAFFIRWLPVAILLVGGLFTVGIDTQRRLSLRAPLDATLPKIIAGYTGVDVELSEAELRVLGATSQLMRVYEPPAERDGSSGFSLFVAYFDQQTQGKTIHSPKNCMPGGGWEPLASHIIPIETAAGAVAVNKYLLQRGSERALVLYWYQGRGRVEANEYVVKFDLLKDAALRGRSDEALVRIVVPLKESEEEAVELAARVAETILPRLDAALPL